MSEFAGDVRVTWIPRKIQNIRKLNAMDEYNGWGWHLDEIGLKLQAARSSQDLGLPPGYSVVWMHAPGSHLGTGHYLALVNKGGGNYEFADIIPGSSYQAYTWIPASALTGNYIPTCVVTATAIYVTAYVGFTTQVVKLRPGIWDADVVPGTAGIYYITRHISRIVGVGFDIISWCVAGNPDNWTSTASGAGSITLMIGNDTLTAVRVVRNQLVILGGRSIHIGYSTGVANPAYRIEQIEDCEDVCTNADSVAQKGDQLFYQGTTNFYSFKEGRQIAIGDQVWSFQNALTGGPPRGLICRSPNAYPSFDVMDTDVRYVLIPRYIGTPVTQRMFAFNITRQQWECWSSATSSLGTAFNYLEAVQDEYILSNAPKFVSSDGRSLQYFDSNVANLAAGIASSLQSPYMQVGESFRDYQLDRVLIKYRTTAALSVSWAAYCAINGDLVSQTGTFTLENTTSFVRSQWLDLNDKNLVGNFFLLDLTITDNDGKVDGTNILFTMQEIDLFFRLSGDFRGN